MLSAVQLYWKNIWNLSVSPYLGDDATVPKILILSKGSGWEGG